MGAGVSFCLIKQYKNVSEAEAKLSEEDTKFEAYVDETFEA